MFLPLSVARSVHITCYDVQAHHNKNFHYVKMHTKACVHVLCYISRSATLDQSLIIHESEALMLSATMSTQTADSCG